MLTEQQILCIGGPLAGQYMESVPGQRRLLVPELVPQRAIQLHAAVEALSFAQFVYVLQRWFLGERYGSVWLWVPHTWNEQQVFDALTQAYVATHGKGDSER